MIAPQPIATTCDRGTSVEAGVIASDASAKHEAAQIEHVSFIGSAGLPNRYGGFESFLEQCAPQLAKHVGTVTVTCDRRLYRERSPTYRGVRRIFIGIPANGAWSMIHDLVAFLAVFARSTHIIVLGVSGGLWFPLFRALCWMTRKRLYVNIDGIEWRRAKFSWAKRVLLRVLDAAAQLSAHQVIYDNAALCDYVLRPCRGKAVEIGYSGDHVLRIAGARQAPMTALTICRIEPENNIELLIEGALGSRLRRYTIVGNWGNSAYASSLRARWSKEPRLELLDPVYDQGALAQLRERCEFYLHGHSVGGTNPSLVEMLFYECQVLCFECAFNRETAGAAAKYFSSVGTLAALIDQGRDRSNQRVTHLKSRYTRAAICAAYLRAIRGGKGSGSVALGDESEEEPLRAAAPSRQGGDMREARSVAGMASQRSDETWK